MRNLTALRLLPALVLLGGCNLSQSYVTPNGQSVVQLAMPPGTPPIAMSRESVLYSVETDVYFPVRAPSDAEMDSLNAMAADASPFARMPWVRRDDYEIELNLVVTNVDTQRVTASVTVNGINEFNRYLPGFSISDNAIVADFAQWERTYSFAPGERRVLTIREEELAEIATDLASVVNTNVTFGEPDPMTMMQATCSDFANEIVYFMNQGGIDERSSMCIPSVIPGLVGFVLGLRAEGSPGEPPPMIAVEATVRLRDVHSRLALTGTPWDVAMLGQIPFTPPVALEP
ncbi:MAG: hypothetical protein U0234_32000 [Sandaracinus sp.]